ncbi:Histidinol-phosphate aminotransferase [subsurface metagenome]
MAISRKLQQQMAEGGWIRKMFEEGIALKKKFGESNVFDLSLGNPVMEPPEEFHQELSRWVNNPRAGMHRYMPNAGYPEVRAAVAEHLSSMTGIPFTQNEIVMTCGAAGGINVALKTIVEAGDEVIILAPYFVEYIYYIDNAQALPRIIPTDNQFAPDLKILEENVTSKTRAVLVNSPNNPTGAVYSHNTLKGIGEVLSRKEVEYGREIFLISDEVYRRLVYDGVECPYVFQYHPRTIVTTSYSKDLALPGERIGYIAVNPLYEGRDELINGLVFCNRVLGFVNAPALMLTPSLSVILTPIQAEVSADLAASASGDRRISRIRRRSRFFAAPSLRSGLRLRMTKRGGDMSFNILTVSISLKSV